jgi:hypothetical protein
MSKAVIQFRLEQLREALQEDYDEILVEIRLTQETLVTAPLRRHDHLMEYLIERVTAVLDNCKANMEDIEKRIVQILEDK